MSRHSAESAAVARNFLALGSGEAVARIIAFLATVYVARALGAASYGTIAFAAAVVLYFSRIADGGIDLGLGVREVAANPRRVGEIAPTLLTVRQVISVLLVTLISSLGLLFMPPREGFILALYSLTLLAVGLSTRWIHLGLERARRPAIAKTLGELLMVLLVLGLVRGPQHIVRVPLAQFAGDLVAALLLLHWLRRDGFSFRPKIRWEVVRSLAGRSWPLVASGLLGLMIYNSDLIFLRLFRSPTQVGYYAASYALISFCANLGIAYGLTLLPTMTRLAASPDRQRALYDTANAHVFAVGFPLAVGTTLLAPSIIGFIFGDAYTPSAPALAVLVWSVPVGLTRNLSIAALISRGREDQVFRSTAVAAATNLGLNLLLIPRFGLLGAASATVATEALRMIVAGVFAASQGFRPTGIARYWRTLISGVTMGGILFVIGPLPVLAAVPAGIAAFVTTLAMLGGIRVRRSGLPTLEV